jgi:gamma-glutamylcyclotransferase (GGCT)/AIG2-like uncharacterized protein YtfP
MRATVEAGLRWLEQRSHPSPDDQWLLVPADHPALDSSVVSLLRQARSKAPDKSILVPTHGGRRGHPTLIGWKHVAGIRALPAGSGLNAYLRQQAGETLEVPVNSPGVLCDLDTPEDYERLTAARCRLFVYGTLMRGGRNHALLAGQRFLREAVTRPNYRLCEVGAYRGLVRADIDGRAIPGELYEIDRRLIRELDELEGAPDLYRLESVEIEGVEEPAYAYFYQRPVGARAAEG